MIADAAVAAAAVAVAFAAVALACVFSYLFIQNAFVCLPIATTLPSLSRLSVTCVNAIDRPFFISSP